MKSNPVGVPEGATGGDSLSLRLGEAWGGFGGGGRRSSTRRGSGGGGALYPRGSVDELDIGSGLVGTELYGASSAGGGGGGGG